MRLLIDGCRSMEWMRWKMGRGDEDRTRDLNEELDEETDVGGVKSRVR